MTLLAKLIPKLLLRPTVKNPKADTHNDFRLLVEGGGWANLPHTVQDRFEALAANSATTTYCGTMHVKRSSLGLFFAQICRLLGNPLVPHQGEDVPVDVNVFAAQGGGICWQRVYKFIGRAPLTVQSVKVVDAKHGLLECIGGGLGMRLKVFEQDRILHFVSHRYFLQIGQFHLPIPLAMTPGTLHVEHIDEGRSLFRFRLSFTHPWFGVSFHQDGVFQKKEPHHE